MESLPAYVPVVFILTTFATLGFVVLSIKKVGIQRLPSQILIFVICLWIFFQAILALGGFYRGTSHFPPSLFVVGVFPALALIILFFVWFRRSFIDHLSLRLLTLVHIARIPVEIVLLWLFFGGLVPRIMTFDGWNFDILSGMLSPIVYIIAFGRGGPKRRWVLIAYNLLGIVLLANIVLIAAFSLPTPMQLTGLDYSNTAVLYFPYVWLPTIVVPVMLFAHLASLYKLIGRKVDRSDA